MRRRFKRILGGLFFAGLLLAGAQYGREHWDELQLDYLLWRMRSAGGTAAVQAVCELGVEVRPRLRAAFTSYGNAPEAGSFRIALFEALRCQRLHEMRRQAGSGDSDLALIDLPVDEEALELLIATADQEPADELRMRMAASAEELDFRFRFALQARLAEGRYPLPLLHFRLPSLEPFVERQESFAAVRDEWCRIVAPVGRRLLSGEAPHAAVFPWVSMMELIRTEITAHCGREDEVALARYVARIDTAIGMQEPHLRPAAWEDALQEWADPLRPVHPSVVTNLLRQALRREPEKAVGFWMALLEIQSSPFLASDLAAGLTAAGRLPAPLARAASAWIRRTELASCQSRENPADCREEVAASIERAQ